MGRRVITIITILFCCLLSPAQTKKSTGQKARTSVTKNTTTTKKKAATTTKKSSAKTTKKTTAKKGTTKKTTTKKQTYTTNEIKGLQNQRQEIQKNIRQQEQKLQNNAKDVKQRMQNLIVINSEMERSQRSIDTIKSQIVNIDGNIKTLDVQLKDLEAQLKQRQENYIKSMRYLAKTRTVQDKLMFIFSAKSLVQMYRRMRFVKQYADYQKGQGELLKQQQKKVDDKQKELAAVKNQKNKKLYEGRQEQKKLRGQHDEQQNMVASLQKEQKTIQSVIAEQKKKDASLNAKIDQLIAVEVAKAKARAEAEAKKKAEEQRRRREQEIARKKAAAERAAREKERRIAEAKAAEERARAEARRAQEARQAAAKKSQEEREAARKDAELAEAKARRAEAHTREVERQASEEKTRTEKELAAAKASKGPSMSSEDSRLSGNFESNRGRLPMPITGSYRIVSHFGQYNVEGLKNVVLDNKGINIKGSAGCKARSIFDGEVSGVFGFAGTMVVMVRHGGYISVYCNLSSVSVSKGQKVKSRQVLGTVGDDNILQFQLRKGVAKINPERWLAH